MIIGNSSDSKNQQQQAAKVDAETNSRLTPSEKEWLKTAREEEQQDEETMSKSKAKIPSNTAASNATGADDNMADEMISFSGDADDKKSKEKSGDRVGHDDKNYGDAAATSSLSTAAAAGSSILKGEGATIVNSTISRNIGSGVGVKTSIGVDGSALEGSISYKGAVGVEAESGVREGEDKEGGRLTEVALVPPSRLELRMWDAKRDALELKVGLRFMLPWVLT